MEAEERPSKLRKLDSEVSERDELVSGKADAARIVLQQSSRLTKPDEPAVAPARIDHDDEDNNDESTANGVGANTSNHEPSNTPLGSAADSAATKDDPPPVAQLSKNQLKKLRSKEIWEAGREDRKIKRKQKIAENKARKRAAKGEAKQLEKGQDGVVPGLDKQASINPAATTSEASAVGSEAIKARVYRRPTLLPVTLILDCGFDSLMTDNERISLGSQLTRCYSDNHKAPFQAHLVVSSWGGHLKERFDTVLSKHHENWKGVRFVEGDFVEAAAQAKEIMKEEPQGGKLAGIFANNKNDNNNEEGNDFVEASPDQLKAQGEVVYLTSDSPHTLERLKPYSTYIIGGLVDKNRHKGICYKTALGKNVKTAKLPIGEYMEMQSRFVLATNHVSEIMVRWLECGDWGEAFLKVMPKRKGARLKGNGKMEGDRSESGRPARRDAENDENDENDEHEQNGSKSETRRNGEEDDNKSEKSDESDQDSPGGVRLEQDSPVDPGLEQALHPVDGEEGSTI